MKIVKSDIEGLVMWLFVAHTTLLMVSAFYIWLGRLKVTSLVLVLVAKRSLICLYNVVPGISQQPTTII